MSVEQRRVHCNGVHQIYSGFTDYTIPIYG